MPNCKCENIKLYDGKHCCMICYMEYVPRGTYDSNCSDEEAEEVFTEVHSMMQKLDDDLEKSFAAIEKILKKHRSK